MKSKLEIIATPFDEENLCRFTLSIDNFLENGITVKSPTGEDSFIDDLFEIDSVSEIFIEKNYIIVRKNTSVPWNQLGKKIGDFLRKSYENGRMFVPESLMTKNESNVWEGNIKQNKEIFKTDIGRKINSIIELSIQPSLGSHGGSVRPIDIKDGVLFLEFLGGCQGCSQVSVTVREGIEKIIKDEIPEIKEIRDITDHAKGANPYYK